MSESVKIHPTRTYPKSTRKWLDIGKNLTFISDTAMLHQDSKRELNQFFPTRPVTQRLLLTRGLTSKIVVHTLQFFQELDQKITSGSKVSNIKTAERSICNLLERNEFFKAEDKTKNGCSKIGTEQKMFIRIAMLNIIVCSMHTRATKTR